jgi:CspA family cold shock protein
MRVSFETEPDKRGKGPKAIDIQRAGSMMRAGHARM